MKSNKNKNRHYEIMNAALVIGEGINEKEVLERIEQILSLLSSEETLTIRLMEEL